MAYEITELPQRDGEIDSLGRKKYTRVFAVDSAPLKYYPERILAALGNDLGLFIGARWRAGSAALGTDEAAYLYCSRLGLRDDPDFNGTRWNVTATYEPIDPVYLGANAIPEDPADAPILIDWDEWSENFALYRDKDGNVLVNTAGDWFNEPVDAERHFPVMKVKRNERSFNPVLAATYRDTVNSTTWTVRGLSIAARMAKCLSIRSTQQCHPEFGYYDEVLYEFAIRNATWTDSNEVDGAGWDLNVQNTGFRKKVGSELKPITDSAGNAILTPVPLDSDGLPLAEPIAPSTAFPNLTFRVRREVNFNSAFNFPGATYPWPPTDPTYS